ncbi:hypothetical protein [Ruminiclostridium cellobioparum]|uniref:Lipoprotein n=1 Tax=Ruminiclostridium cellobioparum subsp. termitidis CT1112 TaxID=1195236 RepID=S0FVG5_RUMCE|nr:hypothetical protein [Ruminiclostridium cellobioparum]EMS72533.1 hypothetical protein CTER_1435 [Ruminiclostridium cellobioparum subsp. termitidis CT1112]
MKRTTLGLIIMAVLMLAGCTNEETNRQLNSFSSQNSSRTSGSTSSQASSLISSQTSASTYSSSNYVKTYDDETHKNVQYEELSFNIGSYHIVSDSSSNNIETFKCEIDKSEGYSWTKTYMTITVREMEKKELHDTNSIVAYLSDRYPNYEKINIYNNVTDNSGIISLYIASQGDQTKYVVSYKEACYLIESDVNEVYLLKNYPSEYYEVHNQKIECANSNITTVNETISYNKSEFEKADYDIIQGINGTKYSAELSRDKEYQYHFTLKNEKLENLLTLSTYGQFDEVIKILDVNMDGYADIRFLEEPGTFNNSYSLYVWDDSAKDFDKVKCEEMISEFDVHDGYLLNHQKADANSVVSQKLVWKNNNTLIKAAEEQYHVD